MISREKWDTLGAWLFLAIAAAFIVYNKPFGAAWFGFCAGDAFQRIRHDR